MQLNRNHRESSFQALSVHATASGIGEHGDEAAAGAGGMAAEDTAAADAEAALWGQSKAGNPLLPRICSRILMDCVAPP